MRQILLSLTVFYALNVEAQTINELTSSVHKDSMYHYSFDFIENPRGAKYLLSKEYYFADNELTDTLKLIYYRASVNDSLSLSGKTRYNINKEINTNITEIYKFSPIVNKLYLAERTTLAYNENNDILKELYENADEDRILINSKKIEHSYYPNKTKASVKESSWDALSSSWYVTESVSYDVFLNADFEKTSTTVHKRTGFREDQFPHSRRTTIKTRAENTTTTISERYDSDLEEWDTTSIYLRAYNSNNKEILFELHLNLFDLLSPHRKTETEYDANGNIKTVTAQKWIRSVNSWRNSTRTLYSYDNKNRILKREKYIAEGTDYVKANKTVYSYSGDNRNAGSNTSYIYNTEIQEWVPDTRRETLFDDNENITFRKDEKWDTASFAYIPLVKEMYSFDSNSKRELFEIWRWDTDLQDWIGYGKYTATYKNNKNILYSSFDYNADLKEWVGNFEKHYYYDFIKDEIKDSLPSDTNQSLGNNIISSPPANADNFIVYPNPSDGTFYLKNNSNKLYMEFMLLNMQGRALRIGMLEEGLTELDFYEIPPGNYILLLQSKDHFTSKKISIY